MNNIAASIEATQVNVNLAEDIFDFSASANISDHLSSLISKRKSWDRLVADSQDRTHKSLISILSPIYDMGLVIKSAMHPDQDFQSKFDDYCAENKLKFHKDSSYFVRICGVVFGREKGNHYSAYGNAMNAAEREKVQMGGFAKWLDDVGGIDAARRRNAKPTETTSDKAGKAVGPITSKSFAQITDPVICASVDKDLMNGRAVLFVSRDENGMLAVHAVSQKDNLVNRVILSLANKASGNGGKVKTSNS